MDKTDQILAAAFLPYFRPDDIVIVAPLHWGLGHASRCIPLIRLLRYHCKKVIIATDGAAMDLLTAEFADIEVVLMPDYGIRYEYESVVFNILLSMPAIIAAVITEQKMAENIVRATGATVILSDNRLGCRVRGVRNYYLTHQVNILHSNIILSTIGTYVHQWFIKKFDLCLVPDMEGENSLCPALSHSKGMETKFIGPLTRIKKLSLPTVYDICLLLSGPEPQRSILEKLLVAELNQMKQYKILIIRGSKTLADCTTTNEHITIQNLSTSADIEYALNASRLLICRSGYSTLMDIHRLEIPAILIPTPGQTEQEYLADISARSTKYSKLNQKELNKLGETIKYLI
jgi:Glycosyltransferase family 28 C-terminal domain